MNWTIDEYDALLFDCDGTVINSMEVHYEGWMHAFRSHHASVDFPRDMYQRMAGMESQKVVAAVGDYNGVQFPFDQLLVVKRTYYLEHLHRVDIIPGVVELARRHQSSHRLAIVTGGGREIVQRSLAATGLDGLFEHIVTFEDVAHGKPAPDMFLLAADLCASAPERCLVFEDAEPGQVGAHAAGMDVLRIETSPWTFLPASKTVPRVG